MTREIALRKSLKSQAKHRLSAQEVTRSSLDGRKQVRHTTYPPLYLMSEWLWPLLMHLIQP